MARTNLITSLSVSRAKLVFMCSNKSLSTNTAVSTKIGPSRTSRFFRPWRQLLQESVFSSSLAWFLIELLLNVDELRSLGQCLLEFRKFGSGLWTSR